MPKRYTLNLTMDSPLRGTHRVRANKGNYTQTGQSATLTYNQSSGTDSRAGDEAALEALYTSTNGGSWDTTTGWASSGMSLSDSIYGVWTETINGELRVRAIMLNGESEGGFEVLYKYSNVAIDGPASGNGLTGILPTELENLKRCLYFNVKQNQIVQNGIPDEMGNMTDLEYCLLNGRTYDPQPDRKHNPGKDGSGSGSDERTNHFTGNFPVGFGNFQNIKEIELMGRNDANISTDLTGTLPDEIGNATTLEGLHIEFQNMTGGIQSQLGSLVNLKAFGCDDGTFDGTLDSSLNNWTNMLFFSIGDNEFSGDLPVLDNWTQIRYFIVRQNNFTGNIEWIGNVNFAEPQNFMLGSNDFTGNIPDISGLTNCTTIEFYLTPLSGSLPNGLQAVTPILYTYGWMPNIVDTLPQSGWPNYGSLRALRMNDMPNLTGNIPANLISQADNSDLQDLYFNGSGFTSCDIQAVANMQNGQVSLAGNHLTPKDLCLDNGTIPSRVASYDSQKPFGSEETISAGTVIDFSSYDHPSNSYTWYRSTDGGSNFSVISGEASTTFNTTGEASGNILRMDIDHPSFAQTFSSNEKTIA